MEATMQAQTVWEISGLGDLEVKLQLLREGKQRQWRAVGEEVGKKWSVDLPSPPGTVIWLPALPGPDALRRVYWWGMEGLGIEWGKAVQLWDSFWLCPLVVRHGKAQAELVRIERVFLGTQRWSPDSPQLIALVAAPPKGEMHLVLAAFLSLKETQAPGAKVPRVSLIFPHEAEVKVGQLLERNKIHTPAMVVWGQARRDKAGIPVNQLSWADLEI
jgi:hypothetical protein